ncbi:MAG: hypothetical protein QOD74_3109 [Variibacter sp.]|nr:hypothetical protein [Variibacter sp.]
MKHFRPVALSERQREALRVLFLIFVFPAVSLATLANPLNHIGSLDPVFYTGLIHDYRQIVDRFGATYYANRVSWIAPAQIANFLFGEHLGYFALRYVFLTAATGAAYTLVRSFYATPVAMFMAAWVSFNPWLVRSLAWDYVDGGAVTYLLVALALVVPTARLRALEHCAAGVFLALATNAYYPALLIGAAFGPGWVFLHEQAGSRELLRSILAGIAGFLIGWVLIATVQYLEYPALGFGREIVSLQTASRLAEGGAAAWYVPFSQVMSARRLYVLAAIGMVGTLLLLVARKRFFSERCGPLAVISLFFAAATALLFVAVHLLFQAGALQLTSFIFAFPAALCVTAALLGESVTDSPPKVVGAAAIAGICGVLVLWIAGALLGPLWDSVTPGDFSVILGAVAALLVLFKRMRATGAPAILLAMLFTASFYASVDGPLAQLPLPAVPGEFARLHDRTLAKPEKDLRAASLDMLRVVKEHVPARASVGFWYPAESSVTHLDTIQSVFLWSYSRLVQPGSVSKGLPEIDDATRERLRQFRFLVLMSSEPNDIEQGLRALQNNGYRLTTSYRGKVTQESFVYSFAIVELERSDAASRAVAAEIALDQFRPLTGASMEQSANTMRLLTADQQWAYSAYADFDPGQRTRDAVLRVRAFVEDGKIGVAVISKADPATVLGETPSLRTGQWETLDVPLPADSKASSVVIRNWSPTGRSIVVVEKVSILHAQ